MIEDVFLGGTVMAGLAAVVSTATCAAAAVMAEPVAHLEEEVESIVEKHQLEEMERQPNVIKHEVVEVLDDDIEPELQRIKDEEDAMEAEENNAPRQPDIPVVIPVSVEEAKVEKEVEEIVEAVQAQPPVAASQPSPPAPVALPVVASQRPQPTASTHVKTPDEVEDLPEHEAVEPDELQISPTEEKIVLDLQEKEVEKEVKSPQGLESEGAQEQRELSEVIVSAQQIEEPSEEEKQPSALKVQIDKLKGVLASVISYYEDLLKSAKLLQNEKLADDVGLHLEQSINLLSSLDSEAVEDEAVLSGVRAAASQTMELVRKCMKLAIELIEAEAEGNKSFMEYLHSEPDLILHCQEIETYCNNLLPATTQNDQEDKQEEAEIEIDEGNYLHLHGKVLSGVRTFFFS